VITPDDINSLFTDRKPIEEEEEEEEVEDDAEMITSTLLLGLGGLGLVLVG
jgi:hypothetical protein